MTSKNGVLLWLLLTSPVPVVAQRQEMARVRKLAGCWTTTVGKFSSVTATPITDIGLTNVPPRVRLDTVPGRGWHGEPRQWLLRAIPGTGGSRYRDGYFAPVGRDSVALHWTNGFVGLSIRAVDAVDTLRGIASAWTDYLGEARATITLRRVTCP